MISHGNAKSKSEKFPPPHQDGAVGFPLGVSQHMNPAYVPGDVPFSCTSFTASKDHAQTWSGPIGDSLASIGVGAPRRKKSTLGDAQDSTKPAAAGNPHKVKR